MLGCCWRLCFPGEHLCAAPRPVSCSMTMCTIEWLACPRPGCLLCGACDCTGQGAHCGLGYERHVEVFWWWREREGGMGEGGELGVGSMGTGLQELPGQPSQQKATTALLSWMGHARISFPLSFSHGVFCGKV